ncbi:MAG: alanine--tRNA ligase [Gemmataceae bacterium]
MPSANEIRQQFIDFFCQKHGHAFVPSSPVVPWDDPTLLFTNAGMNQFKPYFLGTEKPKHPRVANTQKCIRAGGKHNDLDDVGKDTYHHTFFEMLGNWSFGDYFKREAIRWAWELLSDVWKIDKSRLHVTVFEGDPANGIPRDEEAAGFWQSEAGVDPSHIHYFGKKDNFWEMGETGPCGPCTEIHIDRTPDKSGGPLVNKGSADVMEIWNLVFIQFNRNADQSLTPLPAQHVDTGMGFERVTSILQGKTSNYDTDVFGPIFAAIRDVTKAPAYGGRLDDLKDTAYRVIADHIRSLTFAITDGAVPSNEKRGYVLRSILRRAERYGWQQFGTKEPFLYKLVPPVVEHFGGAFPELKREPSKLQSVLLDEETSFLRTLERGLKLFRAAADDARKSKGAITGKQAFDLHTEQGIFIDIVEQMASEEKLGVDRAGYESLFEEFKKTSGQGRKKFVVTAVTGELPRTDDDAKHDFGAPKSEPRGLSPRDARRGQARPLTAKILGWVQNNAVVRTGGIGPGESVALLVDRTNFYAEQGGQTGDTGLIRSESGADFEVEDTQRLGDAVLHIGALVQGRLNVGDTVALAPTATRRLDIQRNHTATHLLNLALRQTLGSHVEQKGSLVDDAKTRFDFSHDKPLSQDDLRAIEDRVNRGVLADMAVHAVVMPLAEAKRIPGVRAVFGEKYPDPVRVVMIGAESPTEATLDMSVEFCGGTHVQRTGTIGPFKIISQEAVAKGVRRVVGVTAQTALHELHNRSATVDVLAAKLQCAPTEVLDRIESLQEEMKKLQLQLKKGLAGDLTSSIDKLVSSAETVANAKLIVGQVPAAGADAIRAQVDRLRSKLGTCAIVFGWDDEGKPGLLVAATDDLVKAGIHSGKIVGEAAKLLEGKGGGNPTLAQAGGKNAAKLSEALALAAQLVKQALQR